MNDNEQLDNLLDEALSAYREAEPLAGIEDRVMRHIQGHKAIRQTRGLRWAIALGCAAVLTLAIWLGLERRTPQTVAPSATATTRPAPAQSLAVAAAVPASVTSANANKASKSTTRTAPAVAPPTQSAHVMPAVFPSPTPLTAEERAFMAGWQRDPQALLAASDADQAITIAEIEIKPLPSSGESLGDKQ